MTPNMQKGQSEGPEVYTMTSLLQEGKSQGPSRSESADFRCKTKRKQSQTKRKKTTKRLWTETSLYT
jgi:hypothetical protein